MASFNPRVFTNPDGLKKISNVHLVALLDKWRNYFAGRNVEIPSDAQTAFPHDDLAAALMTYDEEMPLALMNGLYYIDEAASNETLDDLLDRAREASISIESNGDLTPADVAVQIWLANPDLLEERHMKVMVFKKTAFLQFPGRSATSLTLPAISDQQLAAMATAMDPWFENKQRGRGTRMFAFPRPDENKVWLLVRHGMPMTREGKHEDNGEAGVAFYRPQKHDVLIYDATNDVLAINAQSKGERTLYRETIGATVFGKKSYFGDGSVFTLAPIRREGPKIQDCDGIDGINRVRLTEVVRVIPGDPAIVDIKKSTDLFKAFGDRWSTLLDRGRFTSAKFSFVFEGSSKPRSVTIREDSTKYDRDSDAMLVEQWLRTAGFYDIERETDVIDDNETPVAAA